ncbi:hypothetical protein GLA29479_2669 [Lysobacter antibioticus]|uniref:Uncharacterized protein n=1 Tax=Lysobacter antibioticus TaxID=84531 RepID=A0A0S2DZ34_LYSAN|nr:hypothetical protein GLA29479_2669 [Lysobacter antibioticus]ALN78754.1 hypothetical protein LA76x_0593 [Lysobacter antibioticus]
MAAVISQRRPFEWHRFERTPARRKRAREKAIARRIRGSPPSVFLVAFIERIDQNRCERLRFLDRSSPAANADSTASRPADSSDI